jgi:hypothetical protein
MDIKELGPDWKEKARQKEVAHWKNKYKRCVRLCKAIMDNINSVLYIKDCFDREDNLGASEAWNELEPEVQKLLITAPTYGGPFTTEERAKVKDIWEVTADNL